MDEKVSSLLDALADLRDGETLTLARGARYDVWQDDCTELFGYHASNTETREENPNGRHRVAICLRNKKRIVIDGNGATLMIHGVVTPLLLDACERITIRNLTIDYARPTMSEYLIESLENGVSVLRMGADCLYEVVNDTLVLCGETDRSGKRMWSMPTKGRGILSMYYDPKTEQVRFLGREEGDKFPSLPAIESAEELGDRRVRVVWRDRNAKPPVGCVIQTRGVQRNELGGLLQYCKNIRLERLRIRAMHGFGLLCQYCKNVTYRQLDCTPAEGRTIACNADFFHFSGCSGDIRIEKCIAAGAHDDFVNVHGTHMRVVEADEDRRTITVRFINPNTWGLRAYRVGDRIDLIKGDTLLPYATRRVRCAERLNDTDFRLMLDKRLPEIEIGRDVIENATCTPRLTVRDCFFGPSMGRGILCTTRKRIRIERNLFYKNGGSVLYVADDCNFWMESGYVTDLCFRGNTLVGCGYGPGKHPEPLIYVKAEVAPEAGEPLVHRGIRLIANRVIGERDTPWEKRIAYAAPVKERRNKFEKRSMADDEG